MRLTGKQAAFVHAYLGEARFNATVAAKMAGYRANSKHSFEAIGSENLTKKEIRQAIDTHFKLSRMSAEETLIELTTLARGNSRDKIKALALLSQHHSLLDGKWSAGFNEEEREKAIQHGWDCCRQEFNEQIEKYNAEADATNEKNARIWKSVFDKYEHSPEAIEALIAMHDVLVKGTILRNEDTLELVFAKPKAESVPTPQVIPPERRLEPAPVEKMMAQVTEATPEPEPWVLRTYVGTPEPEPKPAPEMCPHGQPLVDCYNCKNFGDDYNVTTNENGEKVYQFGQAARRQKKRCDGFLIS